MRDRYAELFEAAPSLTAAGSSLVFTGDAVDPETLATLRRIGYRQPEDVTRAVRALAFRGAIRRRARQARASG
ncbi:MAG: hypothetical protein WDM84_07710 [Bauldia sp.]